jgi:hypothetical protein
MEFEAGTSCISMAGILLITDESVINCGVDVARYGTLGCLIVPVPGISRWGYLMGRVGFF